MRAFPRRFLIPFAATALLAACERAATPEVPAPMPVAPPAAPVVQPPVEQTPPPPPSSPVETTEPPRARDGRLPLVRILAIAQRRVPGEVIKVDLDDDDDPPTYELEILTPEGRVMEIKLDARTGAILDIEED